MIRWPRCVAGVLVLLASSAFVRADEPLTRREKGDLAIRARAILKKHCFECHGGPGQSRHHPGTRSLQARRQRSEPGPLCRADRAKASQIMQFLEDGSMPPGDRPRPTEEEIQTLKDWIGATSPSYPAAFDDRTTLQEILNDLQKHPEAAPNLRYFSLAHLVRDDADLPDLKRIEFNLNRALTWCGVKPPAGAPRPSRLTAPRRSSASTCAMPGGTTASLFFRSPKGGSPDLFPLTPYDLILLEYPHAVALLPGDALTPRLTDYFAAARLARPVPFLRR